MNRLPGLFFLLLHLSLSAQNNAADFVPHRDTASHKNNRPWWVTGGHVVGYSAVFVGLNEAWYKDYPRSSFQVFNDSREWLQMDKVGHAWTAYSVARGTAAVWRWSGVNGKHKADALGAASALTYLTIIEVLDAHSAKWGWSWADVGANLSGTGLYLGQQLAWKEQRIGFKFSSAPKNFPADLRQRGNDLFGASFPQRLLKDYNAQTYWLSANFKSFFPKSKVPAWLNVAVGYGAEGMWGGFGNKAVNDAGIVTFDRTDIARVRQWYLSPDVDFTKIKTGKKWVRTILFAANALKMPAPALGYSNGRWRLHPLQF
mgnify:FL=1